MKDSRHYRSLFRGSDRLFKACWRDLRIILAYGAEEPESEEGVIELLDYYAGIRVNNPRSSFYLHG